MRDALADVRLDDTLLGRYPHQVSGGQAQRFAIALAVALRAEVLLADEPTSALDVTVQAQVVELLQRLRDEHGTAMLFISHDLAVIGQLAERVVVMRDGVVVEQGPAARVLTEPEEGYTRALIDAVPVIGRGRLAS
jgi:ABC-type dipeptide/oligopeptide/nickel transport system ATPase component